MLIDVEINQFRLIDGIPMYYDNTENQWVSISRDTVKFGLDSRRITHDMWLKCVGGIYTTVSGYKLIRDSFITAISVQMTEPCSCLFELYKNEDTTPFYSVEIVSDDSIVEDNIREPLTKGDYVRAYSRVNSGYIMYPELVVEYCWRKQLQ